MPVGQRSDQLPQRALRELIAEALKLNGLARYRYGRPHNSRAAEPARNPWILVKRMDPNNVVTICREYPLELRGGGLSGPSPWHDSFVGPILTFSTLIFTLLVSDAIGYGRLFFAPSLDARRRIGKFYPLIAGTVERVLSGLSAKAAVKPDSRADVLTMESQQGVTVKIEPN